MLNHKNIGIKFFIVLTLFISSQFEAFSQCDAELNGLIWSGNEPLISFGNLASHAAPMLWFSPDELLLRDESGNIQLPQPFPFESNDKPVVYYKIGSVYAHDNLPLYKEGNGESQDTRLLDLDQISAIDIDFYYYFEEETGLGSHPHDIESMALQIQVLKNTNCPDQKYNIVVNRVIGRAHGLHWYNNVFDVDNQTFFPLSILIEEGKHASATDKNADGVFTPGFDVTKWVNDAWGVRDVITTGRLFSGGFQGWMAKQRNPNTLLFPNYPESSPNYKDFVEKFGADITDSNTYDLRPYPEYPRKDVDKHLKKLMKGKKPHVWPKLNKTKGDGKVRQWIREERAYRSLGLSYRWDESNGPSLAIPLGIFKSVEAPLTGGWIYHKVYVPLDTIYPISGNAYERRLGHQIVHSSSASRWIDSYVGLGYEWHGDFLPNDEIDGTLRFVSEAGIKIRVNISKTPLRFLRYIGGRFWGIRLGWKNIGFRNFSQSGFVLEIGAGAF